MSARVVGVDIGTTSVKAVSVDEAGAVRAHARVAYRLETAVAGHAVQDPLRVVTATLEAIGAVTAAHPRPAAIAFSSAMHSLVGVDADGAPLTPLVTWADTRASAQADRLRVEHPELHERTGTPLHPMSPLAKLMWFRENEPVLFARVRRWVGIKELVLARITSEWVIDTSCASGTGLVNLATLDWDPIAVQLASVQAEQLSRIVATTDTLRSTTPDTAIVAGAGDGPLANVGLGAVRRGVAACSIGTSGAVRLVVDRPGVDPRRRLFCYALTPHRWVVGGATNNAGSMLPWLRDTVAADLGDNSEDDLLALAATAPPGCDGLIMLPSLLGERAPRWSTHQRGAYVGLTHAHGRAHLVRAAIEGSCLQLALVLASLRDAGHEVEEVRATGGFAQSTLWAQMLSDVMGVPVAFAAEREGSALGAALLGMDALGLIDSIDRAADLVPAVRTVEPDREAARVYEALLPIFAAASDALDPVFRDLQDLT